MKTLSIASFVDCRFFSLTHPDCSLSYHRNPGHTLGQGLDGHAQSTHCFPHHRDVVIDFPEHLFPSLLLFLDGFRVNGEGRKLLSLGS